jgi:mono/diheme cytochrome c family protein
VQTEKDGGKIDEAHQFPMMMAPPDGTISRDFVPYQIDAADFASAAKIDNPLSPTADVLKSGQQAFNIYCAVCHGNDGDSNKNSYVGYKFSGILPLNSSALLRLTDGELYHIITHGRGRMPNYRAQIPSQARWSVVHYVRALNGASLAASKAEEELKKAEEDAAKDPKNAELKTALETARKVSDVKKVNLALIQQGGTGAEFVPPPAPVPEYVKPQWPE